MAAALAGTEGEEVVEKLTFFFWDRCQHFLHLLVYFLFVARRGRLVHGHGFDRLLPINRVSTKLGVPVVHAWVANVPRENMVVSVGTSLPPR